MDDICSKSIKYVDEIIPFHYAVYENFGARSRYLRQG